MVALLTVVLVSVACACAAKLPDYIQPCSLSDPNLNACALNSVRKALPIMSKGDREFKFPRLEPLIIPEILIQSGDNLKLKLSQVLMNGIGSADMKALNIDFENKYISGEFNIKTFNLISKYLIRGVILIMAVDGQGQLNITMDNTTFKYGFEVDVTERNGEEYISPINPNVSFTTSRVYYNLGNLFGSDSNLGHQVNQFLDENWEDALNQLKPDISEAIATILTSLAKNYFDRISIKDMFLE